MTSFRSVAQEQGMESKSSQSWRPLGLFVMALLLPVTASAQTETFAQETPAQAIDGVAPIEGLAHPTPEERQEFTDIVAAMADQDFPELTFQDGVISLRGGIAEIDLGEEFQYLSPSDTSAVLEGWGNPPDPSTLGMIVPAGLHPFDQTGWGIIVTYAEDGYVEDDDADDIDYEELLETLNEDQQVANQRRRQLGLVEITSLSWAEPPHYDGAHQRLYWAKRLHGADGLDSLNYDIRVLGRRGVLQLSAVAGMGQLAEVKTAMESVMTRVTFTPGNTYADFDPDIDEVAAYGLGALILGKMAGKAGFFAVIFAAILKAKKLVIVGAIGLVAILRRVFRRGEPPQV